jgi:hypothetical protein
MRRWSGRVFALGGLAAGVAAALVAVLAALAAPTPTLSQARAADAATTVAKGPGGALCFTVAGVASSHTCVRALHPEDIRYAVTPGAVGGLAGSWVRAVIVKLTQKGTVWATLQGHGFYAAVPAGHRVRAVVKVLPGGRRQTFPVR